MTLQDSDSPNPSAQRFNDDLLLAEEDRQKAKISFPRLFPALDFPELRDLFARYDKAANQAKRRLRYAGLTAILLGVLALFGASAQPLLETKLSHQEGTPRQPPGDHHRHPVETAVIVFSAVAALSVIVLGALNAKNKRRWLGNRLMTERVRQFQFQMLATQCELILQAAAEEPTMEKFHEIRGRWLAKFCLDYEGHLSGKLTEILDDDADEKFLLHETEAPGTRDHNDAALVEMLEAYKILRIKHQIQYTNYKLTPDRIDLPSQQSSLLTGIALVCIIIVFAIHVVLLGLLYAPFQFVGDPSIHVIVVWTAIVALAARTLEEGLQPSRELERYRAYRARLGRLLAHFDEVLTLRERARVMIEIERAIYQEMRGFLKTNSEARFTI
jgi:hypothetical protein